MENETRTCQACKREMGSRSRRFRCDTCRNFFCVRCCNCHGARESRSTECRSCQFTRESKPRALEAEQKAAHWLHLGNLAKERGEHEKAERHFERSQKHHDDMNRFLGNGDGST